MKIVIHTLVLYYFSIVSLFAQPHYVFPGLGTENEPYEIWNMAQWLILHDSTIVSAIPNWTLGKHFRLMQDLGDVPNPITKGLGMFSGHFNGGGNKITVAMTPASPVSPTWYRAVFVSLYGGTIDSLTVDGYMTEGLAGIVIFVNPYYTGTGGIISNCTSNVIITNTYSTSIMAITGGIASSNNNIIVNSVFNDSIVGVNQIGGIAGENSGTVKNCLNTGRITATNSGNNTNLGGQPTSNNGVGGIVGHITNGCKSVFGNINTGTIEGQGMVGGIVGTVRALPSAPITSNLNYGFVKGTNRVGGIVGWISNAGVAISNNSNFGVVVGEEDTGCIVGRNNGGILINNHYDKQMCGEED